MSHRSSSALETDTQSEKMMVQRDRVLWLFLVILVIVEYVICFFELPSWVGVVAAIGWLGWFLSNELKMILHELIELNDQIAGRKGEFKDIVKG